MHIHATQIIIHFVLIQFLTVITIIIVSSASRKSQILCFHASNIFCFKRQFMYTKQTKLNCSNKTRCNNWTRSPIAIVTTLFYRLIETYKARLLRRIYETRILWVARLLCWCCRSKPLLVSTKPDQPHHRRPFSPPLCCSLPSSDTVAAIPPSPRLLCPDNSGLMTMSTSAVKIDQFGCIFTK